MADEERSGFVTIVSSTSTASTHMPVLQWKVEPLPSDHRVYTLIGNVASEWSHLEHTLDLIIWDLAHIDAEKGACVTAQIIGATPRFRAIITR
jgi:hypothetical protein